MVTYDNLPVYKASYDLLITVFQCVKKMSREYKYTLGSELRTELIQLMKHIYQANSAKERRGDYVAAARENVELIRLYLRILRDLKEVDLDRFVALTLMIETVSKQLTGWQKSCYAQKGQNQVHHGVAERAQ